MPTYDYKCSNCNTQWEQQLKVAERKEPIEKPCPHCKKTGHIELVICAAGVGDSVRLGVTRPPMEFREVLKQIKKNNVGSTIPDY
jgi:putative FmdB family regulatory protein